MPSKHSDRGHFTYGEISIPITVTSNYLIFFGVQARKKMPDLAQLNKDLGLTANYLLVNAIPFLCYIIYKFVSDLPQFHEKDIVLFH